jgi:hypothetical protein
VIDHISNISNVVGSRVVDGYIPPATLGLKTCDRESLPRGHVLKAADSSLTRRRTPTGVEVENKG